MCTAGNGTYVVKRVPRSSTRYTFHESNKKCRLNDMQLSDPAVSDCMVRKDPDALGWTFKSDPWLSNGTASGWEYTVPDVLCYKRKFYKYRKVPR